MKNQPTLGERTTQTLRNAILRVQFKPGERLVERDLCERMGVSRTCVRGALQRLESEGLVTRSLTKGMSVAVVSRDEARQIYELRATLESETARWFVERASPAETIALREAYEAVSGAIRNGDIEAYVDGLARFYDVLFEGSRNPLAHRLLRTLNARITFLRSFTASRASPSRRIETAGLMGQIVEAAEARDPDLIALRCRRFVERSAEFALSVLDERAL